MTSELLPCPFCGSEAWVVPIGPLAARVECQDCDAMVVGHTRDRAITAWNTRAKADQIMGLEGAIKVGDEVAYTMAGGLSVVVVEGPEPIWKVQWFDGSTSWVREAQLLLKGPTHD